MTGWGQSGPLAPRAGHDITYLAVSGALGLIGPPDQPPVPPVNLVGDFGGGGMLLALGILAALNWGAARTVWWSNWPDCTRTRKPDSATERFPTSR